VATWWTVGSGDDDETTVVGMVVAEGHGGEREREREGEEREKLQNWGKWLVFWPTLDPIFFSFRP
jgi:hypothetical protein